MAYAQCIHAVLVTDLRVNGVVCFFKKKCIYLFIYLFKKALYNVRAHKNLKCLTVHEFSFSFFM